MSISILMYGRDAQLLETRQWILEGCGYQVCTLTEISEISPVLQLNKFDLLILCHSLSLEDCGRALAYTSARWPLIKSLVLTAGARGCHAEMLAEIFDTMDGPAKLVARVDQVVHHETASYAHTF